MAEAALSLHSGGELVTIDELKAEKAPPAAGRWYPLSHWSVLSGVVTTLAEADYQIKSQQLALDKGGKMSR